MPDVKEIQEQDSARKYGPKATLAQVSVLFAKTKVLNKKCLTFIEICESVWPQ